MEKKELVFVPTPGSGHIVSMVEFAKSLLQLEPHLSITFIVIQPISAPTGRYSQEFASSNPNIQFIDLEKSDYEPPEPRLKSFENIFSDYVESHKSHVKDAITKHVLSKSIPVAGVVVDLFCSVAIEVANELGISSYVFYTSGAGFLGMMLYLPIHYNQIGREFSLSDPDSIISTYANPVPSRFLPTFLCEKDGGYNSFLQHAIRMKQSTKGIFVNTFAELEPHAVKALISDPQVPKVYTVGPLICHDGHNKSQTDNEKIIKWLDYQPPSSVVFLCFGSGGSFEPPQLEQIAIALEKSGHRFLWAIRLSPRTEVSAGPAKNNFSEVLPVGFLERTQNRGLICGWAPQVEVLAHEAVGGFVSHCGWNSTLESIWNGVPMATWPIYAEQQPNAFELVKELGLGVELKIDYRIEHSHKLVMADEIEKAIRCLMDAENPVRKKAKEMRDVARKALLDGGSSFLSMRRLIDDILINIQ